MRIERIALMTTTALVCFILCAPPAFGGLWQDYKDLFDRRVGQVQEMDLWGNTVLPVRGMFAFQYKYNTTRCNERYGERGEVGPILAPLDIMGGKLDFGPGGVGEGHTFQFLLGLGEGVAFGVEIPFVRYELEFDVKYSPPTDSLSEVAAEIISRAWGTERFTDSIEGLWQTIELLGHPRPSFTGQNSSLQMGDMSVAMGWNYLRGKRVSLMTVLKLALPTGPVAHQDKAIIFALGPDIDVGVGSLGIQFGNMVDFRLPKPLDNFVITAEAYYTYYREQTRKAPTLFTKPNQGVIGLLDFAGADVGPYFPDLSRMKAEYTYKPGPNWKWVVQCGGALFGILPLGVGIQGTYFQTSEIISNSKEFMQYVDAVGLVADAYIYELWFKVPIGLYPLRIPVTIAAGFNTPVAGKNYFILRDNWDFSLMFYSPWIFGEGK